MKATLRGFAWALLLLLNGRAAASVHAAERKPDVEIQGVLRGADNATTRDLAFTVPKGVFQVRVAFDYAGRDQGTTVTLGLFDPERERGWGGGVKRDFVVSEAFATPSFTPGPIKPGLWRLRMGVASIRPQTVAPYRARIFFSRADDLSEVAFAPAPIDDKPGWYRGDLHSHTGHSDAVCLSLAGKGAPCPLVFTLQAAVARGLDFISISDHNTTSQFAAMGEMQAYFDTLLLLPGREITTREGHANLTGYMGPLETGLGAGGAPSVNAILRAAHATGGFVSLNHPAIPSGEDCLGCGWIAPHTDYAAVDGIEVVNGGTLAEFKGDPEAAKTLHLAFWEVLLARGLRLTAVGGGDNHDALQGHEAGPSPIGPQSPVGYPTTVVYARNLSQPAILEGLRSGRVFIDLGQGRDRRLDLTARTGAAEAAMGGALPIHSAKAVVTGRVQVVGATGGRVSLVVDGRSAPIVLPTLKQVGQTQSFTLENLEKAAFFRAEVHDQAGRLLMLSNPIYLTHPR